MRQGNSAGDTVERAAKRNELLADVLLRLAALIKAPCAKDEKDEKEPGMSTEAKSSEPEPKRRQVRRQQGLGAGRG
ncbi:hypothetical protein THAOC_03355, partial [Thalassiosira oceanica]